MDRTFFLGAGLIVLTAVSLGLIAGSNATPSFGSGEVAIIQLDGAISPSSSGSFGSQSVTPDTVRNLNERALNSGASAIIYEWNSGGGSVVASKDVRREIESVDVPTVCRFRDVAASGAYLASLGCDRIVADSASLTGSIGVTFSYLEFSGLLDRYGVEYVNISSGNLKGVGSPYKNLSEGEREVLERITEQTSAEFLGEVREERNLTDEQVEEISSASIYRGDNAQELGLVDSLGGRQEAIEQAENMTGRELEPFTVDSRQNFNILSLLTADSMLKNYLENEVPIRAQWR